MSLPSVWFDEKRGVYRARFRSGKSDIKRNVPRRVFTDLRIAPDAESPKARQVATAWAYAEAQRGVGTQRKAAEMSLADLFAYYARENPEDLDPKTLTRDGQHLANVSRYLAHDRPSQIDRHRLTEYRNARLSEKNPPSPRTVEGEMWFLHKLVKFGYEWRKVTGVGELNLLTLPKIRQSQDPDDLRGIALSLDEIKAVMAYEFPRGGREFHRMFLFGLCSMLRLHPLRNLRREWIDHKRGWLTVPAHVMKGRTKRKLSAPLAAVALAQVEAGKGYAFEVDGKPYYKWPRRCSEQLQKHAGVRFFTTHDLRRTGVTMLAEAGVPKEVRKILMGHSAGDVTDDYVRRWEKQLREAVAVFDQILGGNNVPK